MSSKLSVDPNVKHRTVSSRMPRNCKYFCFRYTFFVENNWKIKFTLGSYENIQLQPNFEHDERTDIFHQCLSKGWWYWRSIYPEVFAANWQWHLGRKSNQGMVQQLQIWPHLSVEQGSLRQPIHAASCNYPWITHEIGISSWQVLCLRLFVIRASTTIYWFRNSSVYQIFFTGLGLNLGIALSNFPNGVAGWVSPFRLTTNQLWWDSNLKLINNLTIRSLDHHISIQVLDQM